MGISRYSRSNRRWEEAFDHLQFRCTIYGDDVTVGDLLAHGIKRAAWTCRSPSCWRRSAPFALDQFGPALRITKLRWKFVCSQCGTKRPMIELIAE
jgi:hypothetical protein